MIYIYVLKCPFTGAVRYVGKGVNLKARLRQHIHDARSGLKSHKCEWIRSVLKRGRRPVIEVDVIVQDGQCWKVLEQERIIHHRDLGCDLTNGRDLYT